MKGKSVPSQIIANGLLLVLAFSPALLASNRPVSWMLWATVIFIFVSIYFANNLDARPKHIGISKFGPLPVFAGILCGFIALQSLNIIGETPRASLLALVRTISYTAYFWLMVQFLQSAKSRCKISYALVTIILLYALYGFAVRYGLLPQMQVFFTEQYADSITGSFINRNSFALYLGMGMQICLMLLINEISASKNSEIFKPESIILMLVLALLFIIIAQTNSRMGIAGSIVGSLVLVIISLKTKSGIAVSLLIFITLFMLVFVFFGEGLNARFHSIFFDLKQRKELYSQVWRMIMESPLTGFGSDSFEITFPKFKTLPLDPALTWDKAHNSYLTNWAELGLIIGSIPLIMLGYLLLSFLKSQGLYASLAIAILAQNAFHSSVDFGLEIQANLLLLLAILAMAFAEKIERS